jgi:hypothetical protein
MAKARATSSKSADALAAAAVEYFASRSHNAWRRQFHKDQPKEKLRPRMRLRGGVMVDINKPWAKLDPAAKADNRVAAYDAHKAIVRFPKNREAASAFIHTRWIARNKRDPNQPKELMRPYKALPEVEKDKDRAHFDRMTVAFAAVKKKIKAKKKAAQKAKTAKQPQKSKTPPKRRGATKAAPKRATRPAVKKKKAAKQAPKRRRVKKATPKRAASKRK